MQSGQQQGEHPQPQREAGGGHVRGGSVARGRTAASLRTPPRSCHPESPLSTQARLRLPFRLSTPGAPARLRKAPRAGRGQSRRLAVGGAKPSQAASPELLHSRGANAWHARGGRRGRRPPAAGEPGAARLEGRYGRRAGGAAQGGHGGTRVGREGTDVTSAPRTLCRGGVLAFRLLVWAARPISGEPNCPATFLVGVERHKLVTHLGWR